jgi:hypothetical protein
VSIHVADLRYPGLELQIETEDWTRILDHLLTRQAIEPDDLLQLNGLTRAEIPVEMARRIGTCLEEMFFDEVRERMTAPKMPDYVRPIAASNGVWIDPALPLLNRRLDGIAYIRFANFCQTCRGFSIG